jgi:hypothetical protein
MLLTAEYLTIELLVDGFPANPSIVFTIIKGAVLKVEIFSIKGSLFYVK